MSDERFFNSQIEIITQSHQDFVLYWYIQKYSMILRAVNENFNPFKPNGLLSQLFGQVYF